MFSFFRLCHRRSDSDHSSDYYDDDEPPVKQKCMRWINKSSSKDKLFIQPPPPPSPEINLLCSYGGRFKDENHCNPKTYYGGEKRIITVNRYFSASKLFHHLYTNLFAGGLNNNFNFTLNYHTLIVSTATYSLITVVTDEDLQHMIREYDRFNPDNTRHRYLHVYLFPRYHLQEYPNQSFHTSSGISKCDDRTKLRLMCRTGGHFYFYPCRNLQSYEGGLSRAVIMDHRPSCLSHFLSYLSRALFNGSISFTVKYSLDYDRPNCLVSLTNDEDLRNMIQLYDIYSSSFVKPYHLLLHFFPVEAHSKKTTTPLKLPISPDDRVIAPGSDDNLESEVVPGASSTGLQSAADSHISCCAAMNVSSEEEAVTAPVLHRAQVQVIHDPNCRFQTALVRNNSGDFSNLEPLQVQQLQKSVRPGTLCIDHATGLPLMS